MSNSIPIFHITKAESLKPISILLITSANTMKERKTAVELVFFSLEGFL